MCVWRKILVVLILLAWAAAVAAVPRVADRSVFSPGLWWDSDHPGHGFDIHADALNVGIVWYTYSGNGDARWYLASGQPDSTGLLDTTLLELRREQGAVHSREVGRVRLQRRNAELAKLDWQIDDRGGSWLLEPFRIDAQLDEQDRAGAYEDRARPGLGLTVDTQGALHNIAWYAFDRDGAPMWWIGARDADAVDLAIGPDGMPIPGAAPSESARLRATLALAGEGRGDLVIRGGDEALEEALLNTPISLQRFTRGLQARQADFRLSHFDSPATLEEFLRQTMLDPKNWRLPGWDSTPTSAPWVTRYEVNYPNRVDAPGAGTEPAIHAPDGKWHYSAGYSLAGVMDETVIVRERSASAGWRVVYLLALPAVDKRLERTGVYIQGDRLVVVRSMRVLTPHAFLALPDPFLAHGKRTVVDVFDRTDPARPTLLWSAMLDADLVEARGVGNDLYMSLRFAPDLERFEWGGQGNNPTIVRRAEAASFLPRIVVNGQARPLLAWDRVVLPPPGGERRRSRLSSYVQSDLLVLTRLSLLDPNDMDALGVLGGVGVVRFGAEAAYLVTSRQRPQPFWALGAFPGSVDLHRVDIVDRKFVLGPSAALEGDVNLARPTKALQLLPGAEGVDVLLASRKVPQQFSSLVRLGASLSQPGLLRPTLSAGPHLSTENLDPEGAFIEWMLPGGSHLFLQRLVNRSQSETPGPRAVPVDGACCAGALGGAMRSLVQAITLDDDVVAIVGHAGFTDFFLEGSNNGSLVIALVELSASAGPRLIDQLFIGQGGTKTAALRSYQALSVAEIQPDVRRLVIPIRVHGEPLPAAADDGLSTTKPFTHSAAYAIDVVGRGREARLRVHGALITHRVGEATLSADLTATDARSLVDEEGVTYFNGGALWHASWGALDRPSGPH
jgi:hypothetical protein